MTADELTTTMLAELRREFFQGASERQFRQQVPLLTEAICYPAPVPE